MCSSVEIATPIRAICHGGYTAGPIRVATETKFVQQLHNYPLFGVQGLFFTYPFFPFLPALAGPNGTKIARMFTEEDVVPGAKPVEGGSRKVRTTEG